MPDPNHANDLLVEAHTRTTSRGCTASWSTRRDRTAPVPLRRPLPSMSSPTRIPRKLPPHCLRANLSVVSRQDRWQESAGVSDESTGEADSDESTGEADAVADFSVAPVRYADGTVDLSSTDLTSGGFGAPGRRAAAGATPPAMRPSIEREPCRRQRQRLGRYAVALPALR